MGARVQQADDRPGHAADPRLVQGAVGGKDEVTPLLPADRPIDELERQRFGVDHCLLGAHLARRWRLSQEQEAIIGSHHRTRHRVAQLDARYWPEGVGPSTNAVDDVALLVQIADRFSERRLGMTSHTR